MSGMTLEQAFQEISVSNTAFKLLRVLPESEEEWATYREAVEVAIDHMPELPGCFGIIPVEDIDAPEWEKVRKVSGECTNCAGHRIVHHSDRCEH